MPDHSSGHRALSRLLARYLLVLGLAAGTLLATATAASAEGTCIDVYRNGYGTTVCTP